MEPTLYEMPTISKGTPLWIHCWTWWIIGNVSEFTKYVIFIQQISRNSYKTFKRYCIFARENWLLEFLWFGQNPLAVDFFVYLFGKIEIPKGKHQMSLIQRLNKLFWISEKVKIIFWNISRHFRFFNSFFWYSLDRDLFKSGHYFFIQPKLDLLWIFEENRCP